LIRWPEERAGVSAPIGGGWGVDADERPTSDDRFEAVGRIASGRLLDVELRDCELGPPGPPYADAPLIGVVDYHD
jgi:hypothetical protein